MIIDLLPQLAKLRVVLASSSPRRIELLQRAGVRPEVIPSSFAEDLPKGDDPIAYCLATARAKALDVARKLTAEGSPFDLLLASDSIVVDAQGAVLEKAADAGDAARMLRLLSGSSSRVVSSVVLLSAESVTHPAAAASLVEDVGGGARYHEIAFADVTSVHFATLPEPVIRAYVADEAAWRGKAGAYGIQDVAAQFISRIEGDYYTVMGLPLQRTCAAIRRVLVGGAA